jgi:outer membrane receptor protein involved in Fe transport
LTARYQLFESTALKAAFGMYSQAPAPNQANDVFGNPNLVLEQALHFSTGFEQQILPALKLDAQFYYIHRYNMGVRSDAIRFENGVPDPVVFSSEGGGHSFGLEVMLKHEVTRNFYGWLAYTLSRSVARREANGELVRFIFDQTHILTLVASYRFGWGIEAGIRFRLVSGRPETPVLGGIFDSDGDFYRSIFGEERSVDRPLFHQLDVRVEKTWIFELWRLSLYLDIQNVYNAENPEATLYDYRLRESGPLPGLPILPTLGIKGSF